LEFVKHDNTGIIVDPNPGEMARAIDEVASSDSYAKELGLSGKKRILEMNITWDNVIKELIV